MNFISIGSHLQHPSSEAPQILAKEKSILDQKSVISSDRAATTLARIASRNRMTAENRVKALCDDHTPWLLGEFQGYDRPAEGSSKPYRLGVICAIGTVQNRKAMIIANDNTITAGAWWPGTPQKIVHYQKVALQLQIPVFYLIECAGLYLPHQDQTFAGPDGAGAIFEMQAKLSKAGIRQMAAIFGDCIAGGGYMPLLCDKIVMTEQASICIAGTAITSHTKGAQNQALGTPATHVHISGCAESRVPDDNAAILKLQQWTKALPSSGVDYFRLSEALESPYPAEDLYHLLPVSSNQPFSIEQIIARLADGALVHPLYPNQGPEIFSALTLIDGLPVIFIANQATTTQTALGKLCAGNILYLEGIKKIRRICENAHSDGIPIISLQDVAGFDVGEEAENEGLLRHGAALLREITDAAYIQAPHLTIILKKASGAGYYAMKGAPFHPALTLALAVSRIEVMSPETLAGTLYDRKIKAASDSPEKQNQLIAEKQKTIQFQNESAQPETAATRGDIDDVLSLSDLRTRIITFLHCAYQNAARDIKPVRLWATLNDF